MLVKFLSFTASLIGTGRYKPILLSGLVVLLSLSSVVALGSWKDDQGRSVASKLLLQENKNTSSPQEFQAKQQSTIAQTPASDSQTASKSDDTSSTSSAIAASIDVSSQTVALVTGHTSDSLAASVKGGSWDFSITSEDPNLVVKTSETSNNSIKFNVSAEETAQAGTYRLAAQAKDKDTGKTILTKTIIVTVTAQ